MSTGIATAPASSANLGPGFDCLGLAVDLWCRVEATPADDWVVAEVGREFVPKPTDFVRRAVDAAVGRPMRLVIHSDVPRSRGLGSSSAVMVAGAAAALRAMGEEPESGPLFELVSAIEGHGDNAGAAVYGGLVAVADGTLQHLELDPALRFVFGVPDEPLKTAKARMALPAEMSRRAAARNVARAAFLIEGLRTGDGSVLSKACGDEIHETHRADLSPLTGEMMRAAIAAGAYHSAWSGAGPTAIAVAHDPAPVVAALEKTLGERGRAVVLDVTQDGWR